MGHGVEFFLPSLDSSGDMSHHDITPLMWPLLGGDFSEGLLHYELPQQTPLKASLLLPKHGFNTPH